MNILVKSHDMKNLFFILEWTGETVFTQYNISIEHFKVLFI